MTTFARLDLPVWRNDDVYEFPLRIIGPNLTSVAMALQARRQGDMPGQPDINLARVSNGNAEGIRLARVTMVDGRYENDVRIRLNKSTRQGLPFEGELGDAATLDYAMLIGGRTRLIGKFILPAHAFGSDDAPASRPASFDAFRNLASAPAGATLTISEDEGASIVLNGADLLAPLVVNAQAAVTSAMQEKVGAQVARTFSEAAAARAELARDTAFQDKTLHKTIQEGLDATPEGERFSVEGDGIGVYATSYRMVGGVAVEPLSYPSKLAYDQVREAADVARYQSNIAELHGPVLNGQRGMALRKVGPVITPSQEPGFEWMSGMVEGMSVWWDANDYRYHTLFTAYSSVDHASAVASHGHAVSLDLVNWTIDPTPIFGASGVPGSEDFGGTTGPVMVLENGIYHLFYIGLQVAGYEQGEKTICLATAPAVNGPWTRHGVKIAKGVDGTASKWRFQSVWHPNIVKRGGVYYLFFNATGRTAGGIQDREQIGYATAPSLMGPWTVDDANSPLITTGEAGSWNEYISGDPFVYRDGDLWVMDFFGSGFGSASDGLAFTTDAEFPLGWRQHPDNPLMKPTAGTYDAQYAHKPGIFFHGSDKYHYYTAVVNAGTIDERRWIALAVQDRAADRRHVALPEEVVFENVTPSGTFTIIARLRSTSGPQYSVAYNEPTGELKVERDGVNGYPALPIFSVGKDGISRLTAIEAAVTFQGNWSNADSPLRVRREGDRVFLNGALQNGIQADGTPFFTLPEGFRPASPVGIVMRVGTKVVSGYILPNGTGYISNGAPLGHNEIAFDGVNFLAV